MITGVHALIYSDDASATRSFFRDVLGWSSVVHEESGREWLIFKTGPSELGVHPTAGKRSDGESWSSPRHHLVSLVCDDVERTRAELESKGARFSGGIEDRGFGLATMMQVPGADDIMVYQPSHPTAYDL
ncbi:VOC family protein [Actinopolymorpha rutila]|uniref:Catechol 2,3-dioxygenase-like lactoylglutathione lyase family enzyme n=1 Tax=Actinopolymorpha rutila TaxID=446787 RepID=A0A852ZDH4_9ACTN|nr:VOC family protein [Actinopolymorpha rutila]NYH91197.1 catechol 2,3-dioxygenase-like lactoylglutathione lyase family enzyme [Actinopolymorpha rutila]